MRPVDVCVKDCPDRSGTCHSTCEKYLAARAERDAELAELNKRRLQEQDHTQYVKETRKKIKSSFRKNRK